MYPKERGFRKFGLLIGKVALMNACTCRGALAKTFSFVPAFDPVKEFTSNSSTNGVVTSNGGGLSTAEESRRS